MPPLRNFDEARGVLNKIPGLPSGRGQDFVSVFGVQTVFRALYERPLACEASALTTELTAQIISILALKTSFVNIDLLLRQNLAL